MSGRDGASSQGQGQCEGWWRVGNLVVLRVASPTTNLRHVVGDRVRQQQVRESAEHPEQCCNVERGDTAPGHADETRHKEWPQALRVDGWSGVDVAVEKCTKILPIEIANRRVLFRIQH